MPEVTKLVRTPTKDGWYPSASAVGYVVQGTYQRDILLATGGAWTSGTEQEITDVSDVIVASTADRDELFSWIRVKAYLGYTDATSAFEWMFIRQLSTDALPDLNDNSVVEALQKDKRIYSRGLYVTPPMTQMAPPQIKVELYNVKLRYGEELRLVVRPLITTADKGTLYGLLEWRQVGV